MRKLIYFLAITSFLAACGDQHTKQGYLPVTTTSDSAAQLYFNAVDTFHYKGVARAVEMWNHATEMDQNFFMAHVNIAFTYLQFNLVENFTKYANNALACDLEYNKAELIWKEVLEALIEDPEADILTLSEKFVEIYPDVAESHLNMIYPIRIIDMPEKAIQSILKAVELQPDDPWFRCLCGYHLFKNGRFEEAIEQFDVYRDLLPDAPNVYDCYTDLYLDMENYGAAYEYAMKAHQLGWGKTKAEKAKKLLNENRFISLHVFNLANESDEDEFLKIMKNINALVNDLGHGNTKYKVSKIKDIEDNKYKYTLQSTWQNKDAYDKIHNSKEWKDMTNSIGTRWTEIVTDQNKAHYYRIN